MVLGDAAAMLAAEIEAERDDAASIATRLRYAEEKILQQVWLPEQGGRSAAANACTSKP
jgi:hypothetical protein